MMATPPGAWRRHSSRRRTAGRTRPPTALAPLPPCPLPFVLRYNTFAHPRGLPMPAPLANVPVHLITGFLGSGKSTLIHALIAQKPADERWAILVNEFGQVGIDQAMFESRDDLVVKGIPGGCLC